METCCWTRAVADGDQESRRGEKLAVLCRAMVLKSPGVHWVSDPAASYTLAMANCSGVLLKPMQCRDCATPAMLSDTPSHVL